MNSPIRADYMANYHLSLQLTEAVRSDFNRFSTKLASFFAYSSPASLLKTNNR